MLHLRCAKHKGRGGVVYDTPHTVKKGIQLGRLLLGEVSMVLSFPEKSDSSN